MLQLGFQQHNLFLMAEGEEWGQGIFSLVFVAGNLGWFRNLTVVSHVAVNKDVHLSL